MFPFPFSFIGSIVPDVPVGQIANAEAMSFNGTDQYISTNNIFSALDGLQKMTLSLWIKPTNPNTFRHIISIPWDVGTTNSYSNRNVIRLTIRNTNLLWFTVGTDSYRATETTQTLVFNQWNHIAVIVDTTQANAIDRIKIYNNATFSKGSDNMPLNNTFNTSIGGIFIGENASRLAYGFNFQGEMDEVAIWNTALSGPKIQQIYDATAVVGGVPQTANLFTGGLDSSLVYWNRMGDS